MSIWKELTNPSSRAGEYDTAIEAPAPVCTLPQPKSHAPSTTPIESVIGPGVVCAGNLTGEGDLRLAGQIKGDVRLQGTLTLAAGARITGSVIANSVIVGGQLEGNIQSPGHVQLLETGQLIGDVKAKFLTAALGSRMRGHVEFGWDEPESAEVRKVVSAELNGTQPSADTNSA
jgi:cytoskeletal protein CcmA (bactofilin family)